jgi:hypothetical protein
VPAPAPEVEPALDPDATQAYQVEAEPLEPAPEDPYAVHSGDEPLPDPNAAAAGTDPAWGEDTEFFEEPAAAEPEPAPVEHHHEEPHPALHDHDTIHTEEHAPEPVFPTQEAPAVQEPPVEEARPAADGDEDEDEDVLEETPEFLQDAPEHDRLWFEQKPPRDFDFGE